MTIFYTKRWNRCKDNSVSVCNIFKFFCSPKNEKLFRVGGKYPTMFTWGMKNVDIYKTKLSYKLTHNDRQENVDS